MKDFSGWTHCLDCRWAWRAVGLGVLLATSFGLASESEVHEMALPEGECHSLLSREPQHALATSRLAARHGYVPTNSIAFRAYTLRLLLGQMNRLNTNWNLGLTSPVSCSSVTRFHAVPKISGPAASLSVDERFALSVENGRLEQFRDLLHWSGSWTTHSSNMENSENGKPRAREPVANDGKPSSLADLIGDNSRHRSQMLALAARTNSLSEAAAVELAHKALRKLGFSEKQLSIGSIPSVRQFTFEDAKTGRTLPLPHFNVSWHDLTQTKLETVVMEVSGVTSNIVSYFNVAKGSVEFRTPTNYFAMLGVTPTPRLWGRQFGYNPQNTDEFQAFARLFAASQAVWLNERWRLRPEFPRNTNEIRWFDATPNTNAFSIAAEFANGIYLQLDERKLQIFEDYLWKSDSFSGDAKRMKELSDATNLLSSSAALKVAQKALADVGMDEAKLALPKPQVSQVKMRFPDQSKERNTPFFDVVWKTEAAQFPLIAIQVCGITERVTMFVNNLPTVHMYEMPPEFWPSIESGITPAAPDLRRDHPVDPAP